MFYSEVISSTYTLALNAKFIASLAVGVVGAAAAIVRNLSEISEDRSKHATEKMETAKLSTLLDLLVRVPAENAYLACRRELELQMAHSISKLNAVREKAIKRTQAPNRDLTFLQRMFVCFPAAGSLGWIIHGLVYLFLVGGPILVLMLVLFHADPGTIGDVGVLIVFGTMAFRAWALAERKWAQQAGKPPEPAPQGKADVPSVLFVLRKSSGWKMLAAQLCMWTCIFCAVESLEDILMAGIEFHSRGAGTRNAQTDAMGGLLLFLTSLIGFCLCRAWAVAEWLGRFRSSEVDDRTTLPILKHGKTKTGLLATGYFGAIALLLISVLSWPRLFNDLIDRIEFVFLGVAAYTSFHRLLSHDAKGHSSPGLREGWLGGRHPLG